ncbi:MAG TPA: head-tail connector protein [Tepidisphaeraceae bacterium]|nr:head-tail connector protein [Tepidisphaeraceae bacterium]
MATTSPVILAEAKAHLRIDHADDDATLSSYLVAATEWFQNETRLNFAEMDEVPQLLKQGILLLAGHWYESREAATDRRITAIPFAIESIVWQYARPLAV